MKTIILSEHGGPEKLAVGELETPQPTGSQVLVKLAYAGINHVDLWVRKGLPAYPVKLPHVLGGDGAGTVEAVGPDAEGANVGDRVVILPGLACGRCAFCRNGRDNQCDLFEILGAKRHGTYAEYVVVPDQNVLPLPDHVPFDVAAAFPLAYLTAWHMLITRANLQPKETVLVIGASAGVSMAAIQIANWKGSRVFAATTSPEKMDRIREAGPDGIFLNGEGNDLLKEILKQTDGRGVDVVVEHVGPATWETSLKSLARYGRLVTCGATTGNEVKLDLRYVFSRDLSIFGARMGTQKEFQELAATVFDGHITPVIDKTFELGEAAAAHSYIEERKQTGKVLLKLA